MSICAGCDVVAPWGAAVIGAIAGVVYHLASFAVCAMKVDDPIDAVAGKAIRLNLRVCVRVPYTSAYACAY